MTTTYAPTARRSFLRNAAVAAVACSISAGSLLVLETSAASAATADSLPPVSMPMYAHMPNPTPTEIQRHIDEGWATGAFLYYSSSVTFGWSSQWVGLDAAFPDGVDLFVSPKKFTADSLEGWAAKLSPEQAAKTVFAYYQEPEDNLLTPEQQADFRAQVTLAGTILHKYGIRNGIEMQSWTLNENNHNVWAGKANFKKFIPADKSAVDFVGMSMYDTHQNYSGPEQLRPVVNLLERNLPDAEWGPVASGWSVPLNEPAGTALRDTRADAADDAFDYAIRNGASALGWWDWANWEGVEDYDVVTDPTLMTMLTAY